LIPAALEFEWTLYPRSMTHDSILIFADYLIARHTQADARVQWVSSMAELETALLAADPSLIALVLPPKSPLLPEVIERCQTLRPSAPVWIAPFYAESDAPLASLAWLRPRLLSALGCSGGGAEAAARVEALTVLAGGIAHDFNNLLTAIRCYSEILHDELAEAAPSLRDRTSEILLATQRAAFMSRQLLTFSGRATPHAERIDIQEWLPSLSGVLRSILSEQTTLKLNAPPAPLWVEADRNQLEQVLTNLVTNAHEAMPHGGSLEISATKVALPARNPAQVPAGNYVEICVSDSGTGVPVHLRSQLFLPFASTKPRGRGLGLGLATALMIIRRLGGEIIHQPSPSGGAAFSVFLPLSGTAVEGARPIPGALPRGGGERILIAEDDPAIRAVATALLETLGYVADVAGTGAEALDRCERNKGSPYDVLLSDISMPGMSGYDLAERMRRAQPDIALILMSGYAGDPTVVETSRRLGALFLEKPFTRDSLSQRIAEALQLRKSG
jgi:signal transduction histidine kinase/CheY-like chemotaxis protein